MDGWNRRIKLIMTSEQIKKLNIPTCRCGNKLQNGKCRDCDRKENDKMTKTTNRDWTEDFSHENGEYQHICYKCGETFHGHKRRVECKECFDTYAIIPCPHQTEFDKEVGYLVK